MSKMRISFSSILVCTVLLAWSVGLGACQVMYGGNCPPIMSQRDFQATEFMGRWYEANRTTPFYQNPSRCTIADFNRTLFTNTIQLVQSGQNFFGPWMTSEDLVVPQLDRPAELEARVGNINYGVNYKILTTDYRSYAIVWSCNDFFGFFHYETLRIFSRMPRIDYTTLQTIMKYLSDYNINRTGLVATLQDFCTYRPLPMPIPGRKRK